MVGYGSQVFSTKKLVEYPTHFIPTLSCSYSQYWLWCPIIAGCLGAQVATFIYDVFLYGGTNGTIYKTYASVRSSVRVLYLPSHDVDLDLVDHQPF